MSPVSPTVLPQELCEACIDAIPLHTDEDRQSLTSCLMVSRLFFLRARSRLFAHVDLRPYQVEKTNILRQLLEFDGEKGDVKIPGYPDLKPCVKSLKITGPFDAFKADSKGMVGLANAHDVVAILSLLAATGKLKAFHLYFIGPNKLVDVQASPEIYDLIDKIIKSPSLERLAVDDFVEVPSEFFRIWDLREIVLSGVRILDDSEGRPDDPLNTQLRSLDFRFKTPFPKAWMGPQSPFCRLHTLIARFDYASPSSPILNELLALCADTLHTLDVRIQTEIRSPNLVSIPHTLEHLTALQQLRFTVFANLQGRYMFFDRITEVLASLRTMKSVPHSLSRIAVFFYTWIQDNGEIGFRHGESWQSLGDELMDERFNAVKTLEVGFVAVPNVADNTKIPEVRYLQEFPKMWRTRYPRIHATAQQSLKYRDDLLL